MTVCTQGGRYLLGEIIKGKMRKNEVAEMIESWWLKLKDKFTNVQLDEYVIMPNHFHGIIVIVGVDPCVNPEDQKGEHMGSPLHRMIQWFKTMTTNEYIRNVNLSKWTPFSKRLWQRNYYEHVIRNEEKLNKIRQYIQNNPLSWHLDLENPERTGKDLLEEEIFDIRKTKLTNTVPNRGG